MTISKHIKSQYFVNDEQLIRLAPSQPLPQKPTKRKGTPWTDEEHNRFLEALEQYPTGPWKHIAEHVRTRTTRQTMTHAQRYREKIARRRRLLAEAGLPALHLSDDSTSAAGADVKTISKTTTTTIPSDAMAAKASSSQPGSVDSDSESDGDNGDIDMPDGGNHSTSATTRSSSTNDSFDFDLNAIEFEDVEDEELLRSLAGVCDLLPFSEEDAHWLAEHYGSISLDAATLSDRLGEGF